jgi:hypothetical protein
MFDGPPGNGPFAIANVRFSCMCLRVAVIFVIGVLYAVERTKKAPDDNVVALGVD